LFERTIIQYTYTRFFPHIINILPTFKAKIGKYQEQNAIKQSPYERSANSENLSEIVSSQEQLIPSTQRRDFWLDMKRWCNSFFIDPKGKPPSNPYNWPNSTDEDIFERPKRIIKIGSDQKYSFCNNFVRTYKYEPWSFLPKFLLEEFNPTTKIANCYFLCISGN